MKTNTLGNVITINSTVKLPVINHSDKTIVITETFAKAAARFGSDEFKYMMQLRDACRDYQIICRKSRKPKKPSNKISFARMRNYISCLRNSGEILIRFEKVVEYAKAQGGKYDIVRNWFNESFPDYGNLVDFDKDGYPIVAVLYDKVPYDQAAKPLEKSA